MPVFLFLNRAPSKTPQSMWKLLVFEECLLELFKICPTCSRICEVDTFVKGTFMAVTQRCLHQSWVALQPAIWTCLLLCTTLAHRSSRPTRFVKHLTVDILFLAQASHSAAVRCSTCYSTVYPRMERVGSQCLSITVWRMLDIISDFSFQMLKAMHVRTFSKVTHKKHVSKYILPSVLHKWRVHHSELLEAMKDRGSFSLGGDMRADSPGHCAKYGSYSMMDLKTNKIVDVQLVQVNMTR